MKNRHIKWMSIEGFHNVYKGIKSYSKMNKEFVPYKVRYNAKVKLHGTNAGIQIHPDGTVLAQSRSNVIGPQNHNQGFALWVEENKEIFSKSAKDVPFVIFGEWCGTGIQSGVAISNIKKKVFAVFSIQIISDELQNPLIVDPVTIYDWCPTHEKLFVLPWYYSQEEEIDVDFSREITVQTAADKINIEVAKVEELDPWTFSQFGVKGVGEGLVYYPTEINEKNVLSIPTKCDLFSHYIFKAKGEKHKVTRQKKPAQLDPEVLKTIDDFVNMFLTENRLLQGVQEVCSGNYELKHVGDFVQWIASDVKKESEDELEASNLDWKQVHKSVSHRASVWYRDNIQKR